MASRRDSRRTPSYVVPRAVAISLLSVSLAVAGHVLGHGAAPDLPTFLVLVVTGLALGRWLAHGFGPVRTVVGLASVQVLVHVVASWSAAAPLDPRLSAPGHGHAASHGVHVMTSHVLPGAHSADVEMLAWHLLAVPLTALLLVALDRLAALIGRLVGHVARNRPAPVRAPRLPSLRPAPAFLRAVPSRAHLDVLRGNAPPAAA
jgi:hypothetical protein